MSLTITSITDGLAIRSSDEVLASVQAMQYELARTITLSLANRATHVQARLQSLQAVFALSVRLAGTPPAEFGETLTTDMLIPMTPSKAASLDLYMDRNAGYLGGSQAEGASLAALMAEAGYPPPNMQYPVLVETRHQLAGSDSERADPDNWTATTELVWMSGAERAALDGAAQQQDLGNAVVMRNDSSVVWTSKTATETTVTNRYCMDGKAGLRLLADDYASVVASARAIVQESLPDLQQETSAISTGSAALNQVIETGANSVQALRAEGDARTETRREEDTVTIRRDQVRRREFEHIADRDQRDRSNGPGQLIPFKGKGGSS
ncbi:MAG: hypothetical protein JWP36_2341 [Paucimonas sp.]|nr:hypothetical protein [Paucimonas sp.]